MKNNDVLFVIFITMSWSWGIYNAFREGQIFEKPGNWLRSHISEYWLKPIIGCMVCMPSIHGSILYLAISWPYLDLLNWLVIIVCASGLNFIIKEYLYGEND